MSEDQQSFPNREAQKRLLLKLQQSYPEHTDVQRWRAEFPTLVKDLAYLDDHGLVVNKTIAAGGESLPFLAKLTAKGVDFLEQDGGLSAILGVITIKLHDDTIKALVESKIMASDLSPPDKQRYLDRLRSLPADATKHLAMKLIDLGLEKGQPAIDLLGKLFESAPVA